MVTQPTRAQRLAANASFAAGDVDITPYVDELLRLDRAAESVATQLRRTASQISRRNRKPADVALANELFRLADLLEAQ